VAPIPPGFSLLAELPSLRLTGITLQAGGGIGYEIRATGDGAAWFVLWTFPRGSGTGMLTRASPPLAPTREIRALAVVPQPGDQHNGVSRLALDHSVASFPPFRTLSLTLWPAWGLLLLGARLDRTRGLFARLRRRWLVADPWLAVVGALGLAFRVDSPLFLGGCAGIAALLAAKVVQRALRRHGLNAAATLAAAAILVLAAGWVAERLLMRRLARAFDLSVDHRLQPNGDDVNADGIRFRGRPEDVRPKDFNVVFLGDSFTFGLETPYELSYPYVFERLAGARRCDPPVRAINFGWVSSSPLLSLRLLRDVGARYSPDLVLYNLDQTDFHDDLRYEKALRESGEVVRFDRSQLLTAAMRRSSIGRWAERFGRAIADSGRTRVPGPEPDAGRLEVPRDRFFVTSQPLESSRRYIEAGVMRNLQALDTHATTELGARFALVLYPRAYQYSLSESPENIERNAYRVLGEYSQEPFRYFAEKRASLPYPVLSLLPAFRASRRFPLYRHDDPHWTPAGNEVAAQALLDELVAARLIPCR
jgi:hypothetical protein